MSKLILYMSQLVKQVNKRVFAKRRLQKYVLEVNVQQVDIIGNIMMELSDWLIDATYHCKTNGSSRKPLKIEIYQHECCLYLH